MKEDEVQKLGKVPSKHSGVISLFDIEFVQKGIFLKEMSKDFHKAFELRQVSDYKSYEKISTQNIWFVVYSMLLVVKTKHMKRTFNSKLQIINYLLSTQS